MDVIDFRHKTLSRMVQFTAALDRLLKTLPPSLAKNKLQDQWLSCLCVEYPEVAEAESLHKENHEFVKILQKSISTAKRNQR